MASANVTFSIVEQHFIEQIYPKMGDKANFEVEKEKFIRKATCDPKLVAAIEKIYGVKIW